MYLKNQGVFREALLHLFSNADNPLAQLFHHLFQGQDSEFFELSSLVSDKNARAQPVRPSF